ncbi:MAG: hypothetical protein M1837_000471, partial [Sclerophora amabilis]
LVVSRDELEIGKRDITLIFYTHPAVLSSEKKKKKKKKKQQGWSVVWRVEYRGAGIMETYNGHVRTPADAIILFEACRLGHLPRVQRRLSEKERQSIKSGSVFVWDEREAGMRRWTDGKSWSASRVSGSFLTYREMEGKRGGGAAAAAAAAGGGGGFTPAVSTAHSSAGKTPDSTRGSDSDVDMGDEGPDGYRYKPDGLMKQSFSITTSGGAHLHLISYYSRSHPTAQSLTQPSNDPNLRTIRPQKGLYPESTVHDQQNVPVVTRGAMPGTTSYAPPSSHNVPSGGPPGYARSGATHPHSYSIPPGYGWPPSPASTPPNMYPPMGSHGAGTHLPAPNGGNAAGLSPLQYGQNARPSQAAPAVTAYDKSPAPLSNSSLPPPPPPPHHRKSTSPGGSAAQLPHFIPNPSPRVAQAALVAQQAEQANASQIDPRLTALSAPSPLANQARQSPPGSSSRTLEKLDVNPQGNNNNSNNNNNNINNNNNNNGNNNNGNNGNNNSIPSIGVLMNGAADNADARSDHSGSRGGSRSPGGTRKSSGPQDIPSEKLGFGEDVRALRVLDGRFLHSR